MHIPRNELKFYITTASARLLEERLGRVLQKDSHTASGNQYCIRSLYFDSPDSAAYLDKVNGIEKREKYRLRFYNFNTDYLRLEKKEKIGNNSVKIGAPLDQNGFSSLLSGFDPYGSHPLLGELAHRIRHELYRPLLFVDYTRIAFLYPAGNVRITLDSELFACPYRASLQDTAGRIPVLEQKETILEVKYDFFLPPFIAALLEDVPKVACAISKYCKCYEILS